MKTTLCLISALSCLSLASAASASDVLVIDLNDVQQGQQIAYSSVSDSTTHYVDMRPHMSVNTRTAYTMTAPLALPCDVNQLSAGISWRNVSAQPVYVEMSGALYWRGDEHLPVVNVFGQANPHAAESGATAAGSLGTGGFIFLASPPLYDFTVDPSLADPTLAYMNVPGYATPPTNAFASSAPGYFPANVPMEINYRVRAFSSPVYDNARGGFDLAYLVPDSVVWNDAYNVWVIRACPGG